jgi:hypothetical protein
VKWAGYTVPGYCVYPVPSERKILSSRECPVQYPVATIGVKWEKTTV